MINSWWCDAVYVISLRLAKHLMQVSCTFTPAHHMVQFHTSQTAVRFCERQAREKITVADWQETGIIYSPNAQYCMTFYRSDYYHHYYQSDDDDHSDNDVRDDNYYYDNDNYDYYNYDYYSLAVTTK